MEKYIELEVLGFSFNQSKSGTYGLVLGEVGGPRRLVIVVGIPEAQSIAFKLQGTDPPRPLTHDLFQSTLDAFDIFLNRIIIYKFEGDVFHSRLYMQQGMIDKEIDSRTSDAIALSVRLNTPIFTTEEIMKKMSVVFDETKKTSNEKEGGDENFEDYLNDKKFSKLSLNKLQKLLKEAIEKENYEKASILRDEINLRKEKDE